MKGRRGTEEEEEEGGKERGIKERRVDEIWSMPGRWRGGADAAAADKKNVFSWQTERNR